MERRVSDLINAHRVDKNLTEETIEPGWDWSGANLERFNLSNLTLSTHGNQANFTNTNLAMANLRGANLQNANFEGTRTRLLRTHLEGSNLQGANLRGLFLRLTHLERADLSGADIEGTRFINTYVEEAKLYGVNIQDSEGQELLIFKKLDESIVDEAIEIYLYFERYYKDVNLPERISHCYFRRKVLARKEYWQDRKIRAFLKNGTWELFTGYAERPWRVIGTMILTILISTLLYHFIWGGPVYMGKVQSDSFWDSLYFSGVTFSTLGFGDFHPVSHYFGMKLLATIEALMGVILTALFVVTIVRKMSR